MAERSIPSSAELYRLLGVTFLRVARTGIEPRPAKQIELRTSATSRSDHQEEHAAVQKWRFGRRRPEARDGADRALRYATATILDQRHASEDGDAPIKPEMNGNDLSTTRIQWQPAVRRLRQYGQKSARASFPMKWPNRASTSRSRNCLRGGFAPWGIGRRHRRLHRRPDGETWASTSGP